MPPSGTSFGRNTTRSMPTGRRPEESRRRMHLGMTPCTPHLRRLGSPPQFAGKRTFEGAEGNPNGKKGKGKGGKPLGKNPAQTEAPPVKEVRGDGRFLKSSDGMQICYLYSRSKDGCQAVCPEGRAHCCEWCLGPHRTVMCPKHPGWTPPAPNAPKTQKGGGKGRNGK